MTALSDRQQLAVDILTENGGWVTHRNLAAALDTTVTAARKTADALVAHGYATERTIDDEPHIRLTP